MKYLLSILIEFRFQFSNLLLVARNLNFLGRLGKECFAFLLPSKKLGVALLPFKIIDEC